MSPGILKHVTDCTIARSEGAVTKSHNLSFGSSREVPKQTEIHEHLENEIGKAKKLYCIY